MSSNRNLAALTPSFNIPVGSVVVGQTGKTARTKFAGRIVQDKGPQAANVTVLNFATGTEMYVHKSSQMAIATAASDLPSIVMEPTAVMQETRTLAAANDDQDEAQAPVETDLLQVA